MIKQCIDGCIGIGFMTVVNTGLYYANSKISGVGDPKAAAIYSATNTVVSQVAAAAIFIGLTVLIPKMMDDSKIDRTNPFPVLFVVAGIVTTIAGVAAIVGIVSGVFAGKKACRWSGNPITAKEIVLLALIYVVESAVLLNKVSYLPRPKIIL